MDDLSAFSGDPEKPAVETVKHTVAAASDQLSGIASEAKGNIENLRQAAEEKLQEVGEYVHNFDAKAMIEDVFGVVRKSPGVSLAAAFAVGFLLAFAIRARE